MNAACFSKPPFVTTPGLYSCFYPPACPHLGSPALICSCLALVQLLSFLQWHFPYWPNHFVICRHFIFSFPSIFKLWFSCFTSAWERADGRCCLVYVEQCLKWPTWSSHMQLLASSGLFGQPALHICSSICWTPPPNTDGPIVAWQL